MKAVIGEPLTRVDGPAKVSGAARYAAEFQLDGLAHAAVVASTVPGGRIVRIATADAQAVPGVIAVITHENAARLPYRRIEPRPAVDPKAGEQLRVLQGPEVLFSGQPVALVVAETLEAARDAARQVEIDYAAEPVCTVFDPGAARPPSEPSEQAGRPGEVGRGDAERALAAAEVRVEATYVQPREYHNAMEPHATIAAWDGDRLTLYDKSQWVNNVANEIAHVFGMPRERIRVISPFVGGAFGSALRTWPHVTLAALAARQVGRPVRLELSRRELYTSIGYRPLTEQRVALGADRDGRLTAIVHDATAETSTYEEYAETTVEPTRGLYSCANVLTRYRLVERAANTPCPMRAPGTVTGLLALEMAMDELAAELDMDPLELRRRNHAERHEGEDRPWSSKELEACYRAAAERFGWSRRSPRPRSMRDGRMLVGYGMASTTYGAHRSPGSASTTVFANGTAVVRSASSDMGPGTYTSMTQVAAERLGLPAECVRFELGDTALPEAPVHGGSITMASVGNAVAAACDAVREKLGALSGEREAGELPALLARLGLDKVEAEARAEPGEEVKRYASAAFGAVFVEVRVDPDLGTVRVPRIVGAYDIGRVINPVTARSQCIGGMVGGLGMALMEAAEWDPRFGRVMNANLAEYLVPVAADVETLEAIFVPGNDTRFNPLGAKGVAEIAICGVAPAIVNAVYHATGRRIRELPITPERLLT